MNKVLVCKCFLIFLFYLSSSWADEIEAFKENHPFQYELFVSDPTSWGRTRFFPQDLDSPPELSFLSGTVRSFHLLFGNQVQMATYGVRGAGIFDLLFRPEEGYRPSVVVDQTRGKRGSWSKESFYYDDTCRLPDVLGCNVRSDGQGFGSFRRITHNKYVVFPDVAVWTGSANFSNTGLGGGYNANNSIFILSRRLARAYSEDFVQLEAGFFKKAKFKTPVSRVLFEDGTSVTASFSPQHDTRSHVRTFLEKHKAGDALDLAFYYFTDPETADVVRGLAKRGVRVRLICDALANQNKYSKCQSLKEDGVQVRVENWGGKMHLKTAVSNRGVVIGGGNWSQSGFSENDENTLIVEDNQALIADLQHYFRFLWSSLDNCPKCESGEIRAESWDSLNSCTDTIDNDFSGRRDGASHGCQ